MCDALAIGLDAVPYRGKGAALCLELFLLDTIQFVS